MNPSDKPKNQTPLTVLPYLGSDADGQVRLLATHCPACGYNTFPPSTVCPQCMSLAVQPLPLSRVGKLYSFTTVRHGSDQVFGGYVDFPEKIRVFGHLRGFSEQQRPGFDIPVMVVRAAPVEGARTSAPIDFNFAALDATSGEQQ